MEDLIYTRENVYGHKPCVNCPSVGYCKGTDRFYTCETYKDGMRKKWAGERHPKLVLRNKQGQLTVLSLSTL